MQLPPEQVKRFYHIWFELLHYVHEQRHLAPNFPDTPTAMSISPDDTLQLRNVLWADDVLRESFIATNPAGLSSPDLALVASWKYRVDGKFFIVRHLKRYSVFLSEQPAAHAYGVLGLVSPIEEVVSYSPPVYAHAVLLPFEGQITYDSLLEPYSITFGPGFRSGVNDAYRNTQEREGIVTILEPAEVPADLHEVRKGILARNAHIPQCFPQGPGQEGPEPYDSREARFEYRCIRPELSSGAESSTWVARHNSCGCANLPPHIRRRNANDVLQALCPFPR